MSGVMIGFQIITLPCLPVLGIQLYPQLLVSTMQGRSFSYFPGVDSIKPIQLLIKTISCPSVLAVNKLCYPNSLSFPIDGRRVLVTFGGFDLSNIFGDVLLFYVDVMEWRELRTSSSTRPSPRYHHTAVPMGDDGMCIIGLWPVTIQIIKNVVRFV